MVWESFLQMDTAVCRPFVDFTKEWLAEDLDFLSDASRNGKLGFRAVFDKAWTYGQWPANFIADKEPPSIEFLELYALAIVIHLWIEKLANRRVWLYCDNLSVVQMINKSTAGCLYCMKSIQCIVLVS